MLSKKWKMIQKSNFDIFKNIEIDGSTPFKSVTKNNILNLMIDLHNCKDCPKEKDCNGTYELCKVNLLDWLDDIPEYILIREDKK